MQYMNLIILKLKFANTNDSQVKQETTTYLRLFGPTASARRVL